MSNSSIISNNEFVENDDADYSCEFFLCLYGVI